MGWEQFSETKWEQKISSAAWEGLYNCQDWKVQISLCTTYYCSSFYTVHKCSLSSVAWNVALIAWQRHNIGYRCTFHLAINWNHSRKIPYKRDIPSLMSRSTCKCLLLLFLFFPPCWLVEETFHTWLLCILLAGYLGCLRNTDYLNPRAGCRVTH